MPTEGRFGFVTNWRTGKDTPPSKETEVVYVSGSAVQEGGDSGNSADDNSPDSDD